MVDNYKRQKFIEDGVAKLLNDAGRDDFGQEPEQDLLQTLVSDLSDDQRLKLSRALLEDKKLALQAQLRQQYDVEFDALVKRYRGQGHLANTMLSNLKVKYRNYGLEGV